MESSIEMSYNTFISRMMQSTGLPLCQMQTFTEWVENRKNQFNEEADEKEEKEGFVFWLAKKY